MTDIYIYREGEQRGREGGWKGGGLERGREGGRKKRNVAGREAGGRERESNKEMRGR